MAFDHMPAHIVPGHSQGLAKPADRTVLAVLAIPLAHFPPISPLVCAAWPAFGRAPRKSAVGWKIRPVCTFAGCHPILRFGYRLVRLAPSPARSAGMLCFCGPFRRLEAGQVGRSRV